MDGDPNGSQETPQGQEGSPSPQVPEVNGTDGNTGNTGNDFEKQIAERDSKIAALEAQIAEATKTAEAAESLRSEIAGLKAQGESDRIDFQLQLAGVRNVKAARAVLADHGNDIDKLKEAEPWLFEGDGKHAAKGGSGTTGLPNAGAATDEGKQLKHWREIAGLEEEK